VSIKKKLQTN